MAEPQTFVEVMNTIVSAMIPGNPEVVGIGFIHFFVIFLFIFSIMFAAASFVPAFKDEKMRMARIVLSLAIAYFGATTFYITITQYLQWFGFLASLALGIGLVLISIVPGDEKKKKYSPYIMGFSSVLALIIVLWAIFGDGLFTFPLQIIDFIKQQNPGTIILAVVIIIAVAVAVGVTAGSLKAKQPGSGAPPQQQPPAQQPPQH
ncbi:Uncharacterised protein [Candidatus Tiddalikarchaeum anstoanum]|nr:Uncharacterised protein [Candidatus Tiddalikarchaeum anstoanum]